jgi:sarcosine oxidase
VKAVIVGAGIFGASLAWWLARDGHDVTLVDQFEPGDRRASSGGETRLLRCAHGAEADYTAMARRARTLWRTLEEESGEDLFVECGYAWLARRADGWEGASEEVLAAQGIPVERLDPDEAAGLYPSFRGDDLAFVLLEPEGGVLRAERSVRTLAAQAAAHGARLVHGRAQPDGAAAVLDDGTRLEADLVVWACGPWLAKLFPGIVSLRVTRQEPLFLDGGPAWRGLPVWCDYDAARWGSGDIDGYGVKAAIDDEGPVVDPDAELTQDATTEPAVRAYLRKRFPGLADAPLLRTHPCRYELTPDTNFIAAPHPEEPAVWIVGGGSGHGFKHGPALAERVANVIGGRGEPPPHFALGERARSRNLRSRGY